MNRLARIIKSKTFIIGISAIIIYTLSGFFLIPYLVRHYVPKIVDEKIAKKAEIGEVRFNPYIFTFQVNDFSINEPDEQVIFGFKQLFVDFELKSLFKWAWTFGQIDVLEPQVNAVISPDGTLNLAQLVPVSETLSDQDTQEPQKEKDGSPPRLIVENVVIGQGRIDFIDERQSRPAAVSFKPMDLRIENLTTLPELEGTKTITATSADGEVFRWSGTVSLNPVATKGTIVIENVKLATLWKFFRDSVNLDEPDGVLTVSSKYDIDLGDIKPQVTLNDLEINFTGVKLKITDATEPFLELHGTRISGTKVDLVKQQIDVGTLKLDGGFVRLIADENGEFNLERIAGDSAAVSSVSPVGPEPESRSGDPWKIHLAAFELDGLSFDYQDLSRQPNLTAGIGNIKIGLKAEAQAGIAGTTLLADGINVGLSGIVAKLADASEPAIRIDTVSLQNGLYDLADNHFVAENISIDGGGVDFLRHEDGTVNILYLTEPSRREEISEELRETLDRETAFRFLVGTIALSGLDFAFSDFSVKPDSPIINFEDIALVINNVDGKSPMTFDAGFKISQGGQIMASGSVDPSKPSVQSDIHLENITLNTFQPYIEKELSLILDSGAFSSRGNLRYGPEKSDSQLFFEGAFRVDNLRLVEPGVNETFLGWKSLGTEQLKLQLDPNRLEIGQLNLTQLAGKFIIYEDRTLNLVRVIKLDSGNESTPQSVSESKEKKTDPFTVVVRRINLSDGRVEFADLSLTPQFGTRIHELKGAIVGISTMDNARAQVHLDGRVDEYGTAKVEGDLDTSDPKAYTNIGVTFRNVEMTNLTPYSGRFAGRKIDSGKLSVDLKYLIEKGRLAGDNKIIVDRLVLGESVKSPDALNLPLDLAIALLEDSRGVIDIGLPVRGNLDSPEFSFGGLIWKAFTNLITRIVTSPFRALAALIPGGADETFNVIVFEPGRSHIMPPEKEKLVHLVKALQMRPRLKLTIEGRYNPETDMAALRSLSLRRTLAMHQERQPAPGEDPGPLDFSDPMVSESLEQLYAERFGADSLEVFKDELKAAEEKASQDTKEITKDEMDDVTYLAEKLFDRLINTEPIGDRELKTLAEERSQAIMAKLGEPGGIPAERIEVKPPASSAKKDQPAASLNLEPLK